jgi:hypothetical protein
MEELVTDWLTAREAADALGVSPNRVRQLARELQLLEVRRPGQPEPCVPAEFIQDGAVVKGQAGTLTLLHDREFSEAESLEWLFTDDPSLPGRPIDALRENRGTEVRRRAQALD